MYRIAHHITARPISVSGVLREHFKQTPEQTELLLNLGAIYRGKNRVREDVNLEKGEHLRIHLQPKRYSLQGISWAGCVVASSSDWLVIDKPHGVPTHAAVDNEVENLLTQMRQHLNVPLLVTHRLDTPVGGLVLFAKTERFQRNFNRWLLERRIEKEYEAYTEKPAPLGHAVHYMEPSKYGKKRVVPEETKGWDRCELVVKDVKTVEGGFLHRVELLTGRTHQIRAQLSALGCPIQGDRLYGSKIPGMKEGREWIGLRSVKLKWPGSDGVEISTGR